MSIYLSVMLVSLGSDVLSSSVVNPSLLEELSTALLRQVNKLFFA